MIAFLLQAAWSTICFLASFAFSRWGLASLALVFCIGVYDDNVLYCPKCGVYSRKVSQETVIVRCGPLYAQNVKKAVGYTETEEFNEDGTVKRRVSRTTQYVDATAQFRDVVQKTGYVCRSCKLIPAGQRKTTERVVAVQEDNIDERYERRPNLLSLGAK